MAIFLLIDTSQNNASIAIANNNKNICLKENAAFGTHEMWIHNAIKDIFSENNLLLSNIDAISIAIGPGSYTGLRIGLATAKGLCYALKKPLIAIDTLKMMAQAAITNNKDAKYFCPMIDARRMEVFTALFDINLNYIHQPKAIVISDKLWHDELIENKILFFGTGAEKSAQLITTNNAVFENVVFNATHLLLSTIEEYNNKNFANLANIEPAYLKEFYTTAE